MNKIKYIALGCILAFMSSTLLAQQIKTRAVLDSAIILIGDQVHLNVEIDFPKEMRVHLLEKSDSLGKSVEIIDRNLPDTIDIENNYTRLIQKYTVTSFDTGQHVIPPFEFEFAIRDITDTINTNSPILYVYTLPKIDSLFAEIGGPIDIKPPYEAPITFKEIAPWLFGSMLALAILFFIFYAINRYRNKKPIFSFPQKPKEPAHVIALRELDRIKDEKIWQQGHIKDYYSQISDTIREYIENRFGIYALEQTSDQTIAIFNKRPELLEHDVFKNLQRMLSNADLVKFAKYEPQPDDNNLLLVDAYFFVNQTKIVEVKQTNEETDSNNNDEGEEVELK